MNVHLSILLGCLCLFGGELRAQAKVRTSFPFPIQLKGSPQLRGVRVTHVAGFRFVDKAWQEIPVQVDEVNKEGDYVLEGGLPFTKDSDDGIFDSNDEVVISGTDLGDDFIYDQMDVALKDRSKSYWKVCFAHQTENYGCMLLIEQHHPTARTAFPTNVIFDREKQFLSTSNYNYHFIKDKAAMLGEVWLKTANGPTKVFQDSRFLFNLNLPWFLPNFTISNDNFISTIESWQEGPIRTIVAVGVKMKNFLALFNFHMFSELVFYKNALRIPTRIEFTFDPVDFLKPGSGIAYATWFSPGIDWNMETNIVSLPPEGIEAYLKTGKLASEFSTYYAQGSLGSETFLLNIRVDKENLSGVAPPFLFKKSSLQNSELTAHWPWISSMSGDLGVFIDISRIHKGTYEFALDLILASEAHERAMVTRFDVLQSEWQHLISRHN